MTEEDRYSPNTKETIQAVVDNEAIWLIGEAVPCLEDHEPGRRRFYPGAALIFYLVLVQIYGGHRKAARELRDPDVWRLFVEAFRTRYPDQIDRWPRLTKPIRRHHYSWFKSRHVAPNTDFTQRARAIARQVAIENAHELGLATEEGAGSLTHPSRNNVVSADGKVIKPLFGPRKVDKETGELIPKRMDHTADTFIDGTGERVWGNRFVVAVIRGDEENQRIIFDVAEAPRKGGEAKHSLAMFDELLALVPGIQVVVYDGELRGVHLNHLMTEHGVIALARLHNKRNTKPLERHYGPATVHRPDGTTDTVELHLYNGAPRIKQLDEQGDVHPVKLTRVKLTRVQLTNGRWHWYIEFRVPDEHGGGIVRLRGDQTTEDDRNGLNRAEYLRLIADEDPDWSDLMGRRSDSESGNRIIDDDLPRERAHSVGSPSQLFDVIGHMIKRNARAVEIHRRRQADVALLAA